MDIAISLLRILLWNLLIPVFIGYLFTMFLKTDYKNNIALNSCIGFIAIFGIFQPIALSAIYMKTSFHMLTLLIQVIWVVLSGVSLILNRKRFVLCIKAIPSVLKKWNLFLVVSIVLIVLQMYGYIGYEHIDDDDAFFVATATTTIAEDSLYIQDPYTGADFLRLPTRYILSPFSIYYAVMSKLIGIHPAIYAHLYLPIILLAFAYLLYYLWGRELFEDKKSIGIFLLLICVLNIFGNYSEFTTQSFLLTRLWQGKAFLAAGVIPFLLYLCYKIRKESEAGIYWVLLLLGMLAGSLVSSMGIFLAPIVVGCFALADGIQVRKIKRFFGYLLCCIPCIVLGLIYMIII